VDHGQDSSAPRIASAGASRFPWLAAVDDKGQKVRVTDKEIQEIRCCRMEDPLVRFTLSWFAYD
jgi:hypothetical protein